MPQFLNALPRGRCDLLHFGAHAAANIKEQNEIERFVAGEELPDRLLLAVVQHAEIAFAEPG